jgi:hypothetical protein
LYIKVKKHAGLGVPWGTCLFGSARGKLDAGRIEFVLNSLEAKKIIFKVIGFLGHSASDVVLRFVGILSG